MDKMLWTASSRSGIEARPSLTGLLEKNYGTAIVRTSSEFSTFDQEPNRLVCGEFEAIPNKPPTQG